VALALSSSAACLCAAACLCVWSLEDVIKPRYFKLFLGLIGGKRNIVAATAAARARKGNFTAADTRAAARRKIGYV